MLNVIFNNGYETEDEQAWFCITVGWRVTLRPGVTIGHLDRLSELASKTHHDGVLSSTHETFSLDRLDEPVSRPGDLASLYIGELLLYNADQTPVTLDDTKLRRSLRKHPVFPEPLRDVLGRELPGLIEIHPEPAVWVSGCSGSCSVRFGTGAPTDQLVLDEEGAVDVSVSARRRLQRPRPGAPRGSWIVSFYRFG